MTGLENLAKESGLDPEQHGIIEKEIGLVCVDEYWFYSKALFLWILHIAFVILAIN